ncbi:hypothetical protein ABL78_2782 [Leptomonas seymouri]|uniref:Uncharacterized protein n=1 Tax=Leptomonas seymouri TaxID=5684 RepID=A0A0N0P6Y4_LEPSE|nr:hypothetical protein ABL78_2782 [Leptomonas seymouri]|eukprot:KPI88149.1 hypothetical protein ABL78_2782 [Leptomonas seymouri]
MGAFALCIENATRDIHSLLMLHRVHPQVHADIQRILGSLMRKQYTDMKVLYSPGLADSPEQVCRTLVGNIIDQTITTAIPAAEIAALDKRCMRLEGEKCALKAELTKAESQLEEAQALLLSLKDAHDYMLHSYFREVLALRSRINDLKRQSRAYRAHAAAAASAANVSASVGLSSSMGSQLHQFVLNTSPNKGSVASKRPGAEEVSICEAASASNASAPPTSPLASTREAKPDKADGVSANMSLAKTVSFKFKDSVSGERLCSGRGQTASASASTLAGASGAATKMASLVSGGEERSMRIVPFFSSGFTRGQTMMVQTTTACDALPALEPDSVDAIFDYEKYIRILNGDRGPWTQRYSAMMNGSGEGAQQRRCWPRSHASSDALLYGNDMQDGDLFSSLLDQRQREEQTKTKGFQWLLHLALEPIQHQFHAELNHMREAVHTMQEEHARDLQSIRRALTYVQSRNDGLLDFLETFVQETKRTVTLLARDSRAYTVTDLLSNGTLPVEKSETIRTFFSLGAPPSLEAETGGLSPSPLASSTQVAEAAGSDTSGAPTAPSALSHSLRRRREWRLKADVRLDAEKRKAAMAAMDKRLMRSDVSKAAAITTTPPDARNADNYYRADLGLPFWGEHPITTHAQEVFKELQLMAKEMRATRVQQLCSSDEAMFLQGNSEGRRVRVYDGKEGAAGTDRSRAGSAGQRHRNGSLTTPVSETPDSFYASDLEGVPVLLRRRLRDDWRTMTVTKGDGATAADLLLELVHLRMRRACDQVRLARAHDTIIQSYYPDLADREEVLATWTTHGKQVRAGAKMKRPKLPAIKFGSPEDALKHSALQKLRVDTQKRLDTTSQRIVELQRMLQLFFAEYEARDVGEVEGLFGREAAQRLASEEAAGIYRVNGEVKSTEQLWKSPYLNDENHPGGVLYLPIDLAGIVDADGNMVGGADTYAMLNGAPASIASCMNAASSAPREGSAQSREGGKTGPGDEGMATSDTPEPPNTPYTAVMDYCRGVQLGRSLGRRGEPVYLFQDRKTGEYYVGDASGRPLIRSDTEEGSGGVITGGVGGGSSAARPAEEDGWRLPVSMTRILFPAPLRCLPPAVAAAISNEGNNGFVARALRPLYLVPMAAPLSDEEAIIREGWQASHRHGHTRHDPIFYTTLAPLPLSSSYHHVVPQLQDDLGKAAAAATAVADEEGQGSTNVCNKYLSDPPRVFQPPDEAMSMIRVRAVRLQSRNASHSGSRAVAMPDSSAYGASPLTAQTECNPVHTSNLHNSSVSGFAANSSLTGVPSDYKNVDATASPPETICAVPTKTAAMPIAAPVQSTLLPASSRNPSPRSLDPIRTPCAETAAAKTSPEPYRQLSASTTGASALLLSDSAPPSASATVPAASSSIAAAVLLAKQQRAERLAREAEEADLLKAQRQEAWQQQQQGSDARAPVRGNDFLQLPHLHPLRSHGTGMASMLPSAANSARLQRQMRSDKYLLAPPLPSSRRAEASKQSSSWDLKDDA